MTYATKYSRLMIEPEQLAHRVIKGIIRKEQEINQPTWMHQMLKIYQLAPRTFERILHHYLKIKCNEIICRLNIKDIKTDISIDNICCFMSLFLFIRHLIHCVY